MTEMMELPIARIRPNPRQPRVTFDEQKLRELAGSIREHGVIQPLVVSTNGDGYVLIAGERRWRAARLAGMETVPCVVRKHVDEKTMALEALVENFEREDLNVIEEARAFRELKDQFGMDERDIAERVGRHPKTVHDRMKWLELEPEIQGLAAQGKLPKDVRVAEALLSVPAEARAKLAHRLAYEGVRISTIRTACARVAERLAAKAAKEPALDRAKKDCAMAPRGPDRATWKQARNAAAQACAACDIKMETLHDQVQEPAWELVTHASGETCRACNVRDVRGACDACPMVEFLRRLMKEGANHE